MTDAPTSHATLIAEVARLRAEVKELDEVESEEIGL